MCTLHVSAYWYVDRTCILMYLHACVHTYIFYVLDYIQSVCVCTYVLVSWCGGELWVDQRKKCADICDVVQVTDVAHFLIDVN